MERCNIVDSLSDLKTMKYLVIKRTPWLLLAVFGLFGFGFGFGPATPEAAGQIQLNDGEPYSGTLARGNGKKRWAYFYIDVEDWHSEVRIELQTTGRNRGNLFVRHGALPISAAMQQPGAAGEPPRPQRL